MNKKTNSTGDVINIVWLYKKQSFKQNLRHYDVGKLRSEFILLFQTRANHVGLNACLDKKYLARHVLILIFYI